MSLTMVPSLYEYYTASGIHSGLSTNDTYFTLNNKNVTIYSGAMHYFRVPKPYWRDRLRKMRHAGLNTVETYVPWNLHEPQPGFYDFGSGGTDFEDFLDLPQFLKTAQEEDLFAIVRPGPYICAEFEFGGLPSWLLREKNIKVRTSDEKFMKHVTRYFNVLLTILTALQFTKGGPIIALQVENEYGSTEKKTGNNQFKPDLHYVEKLRELFLNNNITELLFTSDNPSAHGSAGTLPKYLFQTANFNKNPQKEFDALKQLQANKPAMAMEFWSGWFNHWSEKRYVGNTSDFYNVLETILKYPASVNFYMFHGGTTWGFLNGANINGDGSQAYYQPDITSYDYDAPLTEYGDYTPKYYIVKELIEKYNNNNNGIVTKLPELVPLKNRKAYDSLKVVKYLSYSEIVDQAPHKLHSPDLMPMELLPINNNTGQSFGYIIYRIKNVNIEENSILKINGYIHDSIMVLVNNKLVSRPLITSNDLNKFGYWRLPNGTVTFPNELENVTLDLVVENMGRNNFGPLESFRQFKGLQEDVYLDGKKLQNWEIVPLEFRKTWTNHLENWQTICGQKIKGPALYKANFSVEKLEDTFLDMTKWSKGIVMVNGFILGRYMHIGPQQTLYLPGPLLKQGENTIVIFEQFSPAEKITFSKNPIYLTKK